MADQQQGATGPRLPPVAAIAAVGGVVLVIVVLIVIRAVGGGSDSPSASTTPTTTATAPKGQTAAVIAKAVAGVPAKVTEQVGDGGIKPLAVLPGPTALVSGKPLVLYVGGEFCPYCAAERWAVVNALSRFGTLSGLGLTTSASDDVYPDTPTFSFHGSSFTSQTVALQALEVVDRSHQPLDALTPAQQALVDKYDAPPYVSSSGSIPFLFIGGRFVLSGSQFSPQLLQGQSQATVADSLNDPSSSEARAILGAANWLTAAICSTTGGKPASACGSALIGSLQKRQRSSGA